jgi:hypothetical protein
MNYKDICFYLLEGPKELQEAAIYVLDRYYPSKEKKLNLRRSNKQIEDIKFYLKKLNKELRYNKKKSILQKLSILIKKFQIISRYNAKNEQKLSLRKEISLTINDFQKRVNLAHQVFLDEMKNSHEENYVMITFFPKTISHLDKNTNILTDIRKIIRDKSREMVRYKYKNKIRYLALPEVDKNGHPHLHFFIYHDLSEVEIKKLQKRIEKEIRSIVKEFDINIKRLGLNNYENYSSPFNNILNKMGNNIRSNKVLYYILIKAFGRRRFLTHSRQVSFFKLKKIMKLLWEVNAFKIKKISYFKLFNLMKKGSNLIQFEILGNPKFIKLSEFINEKLKSIHLVSRVKIDDEILIV